METLKNALDERLEKGANGTRGIPDGSGPDGNGPTGRRRGNCAAALDKQGLSKNKNASNFNSNELKRGIAVEMEHTKDPKVAQEIAEDHLTEDPNYYKKLAKMEKALPNIPVKNKPLINNENRTPPKGYPKDKKEYAIPSEYKYPIDTEEHVRAAMAYFSKPKNANEYSKAQQKSIWNRIQKVAKRFNIEVSKESGPPSVESNLKKSLIMRLEKAEYTKRTGSPGHYKYEYGESKGKSSKESTKGKLSFPDSTSAATNLSREQKTTLDKKFNGKNYKIMKQTNSFVIVQKDNGDRFRIEKNGNWNKTVSGDKKEM